jgi:N-succinyldiaminopimelate aminotransferase
MVTSGATEALAGALMALVRPGDEVVLFEPMYDAYLPLVRRAGGRSASASVAPEVTITSRSGSRSRPWWCR